MAYAQDNKEYLVKAAFIYNFVKFVEWPGDKAVSNHPTIDICVLGDGPMSSTASIFKQASTSKLSLSLVSEASPKAALGHCHVVFIDESESGRMGEILGTLKDKPVLTVSDADGFVEQGGMIGFVLAENKIKFAVNLKAVTAGGLRVDAQLLEIAIKVIGR